MVHEFNGKKYAAASGHQKEWGMRLIADLGLKGSERVLDLGCGDGALTARIADLVPAGEVLGIDASRSMIEAAQANERANLRFLLMDINSLELADRFDIVFSNATLHWIKDHRRLYRNIDRVLGEVARIRFNFGGEGNCSHFIKIVKEAMALDAFATSFAEFEWPWYMPSVDEYSELIEFAGMRHWRVWEENADRFFMGVDAMVAWVDQPSLVPFLAHVPADVARPFREFVVSRMTEETRQPDGRCFETFRRINVSALR
ncbi:MAG: methyltransferase domain-containing protein [Deltaproteobacteria bacterium]|nr:methyltransferase domain-containing protein [Deltaproteobacteria bacterium]